MIVDLRFVPFVQMFVRALYVGRVQNTLTPHDASRSTDWPDALRLVALTLQTGGAFVHPQPAVTTRLPTRGSTVASGMPGGLPLGEPHDRDVVAVVDTEVECVGDAMTERRDARRAGPIADVGADDGDEPPRGDARDAVRRGQDDVRLDERAATTVFVGRVGQSQRDHEAIGRDRRGLAAMDRERGRRRRRDQNREEEPDPTRRHARPPVTRR